MSTAVLSPEEIRAQLISNPEFILEDQDLMKVLVAANDDGNGKNVVDMRGVAMNRLEARLARLEETHRAVIAAAYENLASTNLIHRAVLAMIEPNTFKDFIRNLGNEVAEVMQVDCIRLVLESPLNAEDDTLKKLGGVLHVVEPGFVNAYIGANQDPSDRIVTLRKTRELDTGVYGDTGDWIGSEALIRVDLGDRRLPAMLVLGAESPHQFSPRRGTDLIEFFGETFSRCLCRWLS
ncbi:MAG: DUF484 family protein [Halocynthiibacter sp.]